MNKSRVIIDTNILISYLLKPSQTISSAVNIALKNAKLLISQESFDELRNVIERFVKKKYITIEEASNFLASIIEITEWIKILETVEICRDPKDNKFLELAINGGANFLITGDKDLLVLKQFEKTKILSAKEFIEVFED